MTESRSIPAARHDRTLRRVWSVIRDAAADTPRSYFRPLTMALGLLSRAVRNLGRQTRASAAAALAENRPRPNRRGGEPDRSLESAVTAVIAFLIAAASSRAGQADLAPYMHSLDSDGPTPPRDAPGNPDTILILQRRLFPSGESLDDNLAAILRRHGKLVEVFRDSNRAVRTEFIQEFMRRVDSLVPLTLDRDARKPIGLILDLDLLPPGVDSMANLGFLLKSLRGAGFVSKIVVYSRVPSINDRRVCAVRLGIPERLVFSRMTTNAETVAAEFIDPPQAGR